MILCRRRLLRNHVSETGCAKDVCEEKVEPEKKTRMGSHPHLRPATYEASAARSERTRSRGSCLTLYLFHRVIVGPNKRTDI